MKELHYLLGNSCNLACGFCFWDKRLPDVTWETKKLILDNIIDTCIRNVTISGGEPTLNKDFLRVVKYLNRHHLHVVVHANGVTLDSRKIGVFAGLVRRVSLSLDGSNEAMCVKMRGKTGIFSKIVVVVDKLIKAGVKVNVKTLITRVNAEDIINIGKMLEGKSLEYWSLLEFNPVNRGKNNRKKYEIKDGVFDQLVRSVKNATKIPIKVRLFKRKPERYCFISADAGVFTYIPGKGDVCVGNLKNTRLVDLL